MTFNCALNIIVWNENINFFICHRIRHLYAYKTQCQHEADKGISFIGEILLYAN